MKAVHDLKTRIEWFFVSTYKDTWTRMQIVDKVRELYAEFIEEDAPVNNPPPPHTWLGEVRRLCHLNEVRRIWIDAFSYSRK